MLLPNLYSSDWYNGRPLTWDEALQMDDRYTIRVGVARFRQLRITESEFSDLNNAAYTEQPSVSLL